MLFWLGWGLISTAAGGSPVVETYYPINVDSYWVYEAEGGRFDGLRGEYRFTGQTQLADGSLVWIRVWSVTLPSGEIARDTSFVLVDETQHQVHLIGDRLRRDEMIFLTENLDPGDSWQASPYHQMQQVHVVATEVNALVPAGMFAHCVRLERTNQDFAKFSYLLAPAVGMIEFGTKVNTNKVRNKDAPLPETTWRLVEYSIP